MHCLDNEQVEVNVDLYELPRQCQLPPVSQVLYRRIDELSSYLASAYMCVQQVTHHLATWHHDHALMELQTGFSFTE